MSIELHTEADGKVLAAYLSGKLVKADFVQFVPELERAVRDQGRVRMIVWMHDFHGWTAGGMWEDTKFGLRHFADFERIAMVGDKRWEAWMATFCTPFTTAKVRYFDASKADEAKAWIHEGIEASVSTGGKV